MSIAIFARRRIDMGTLSTRQFAVVTGASSGIGLELAKQCAAHGFDVMICAEDRAIHDAALQIQGTDGVQVKAIQADLATREGCQQLANAVLDYGAPVDALLLNAGIGVGGPFLETSLEDELRVVALNCNHVIYLAKRLVPDMVARGKGRVMITASIASTTPSPYHAVYGATKAFDMSFAEALRTELADTGVTVTALQPGPTDTNFFGRAHMEDTKIGRSEKDDPAGVAKRGFEAMMDGKDSVLAGEFKSKLQGLANEVLPETVKSKASAKQAKPDPGPGRR
jgi:short-subunit dehydrogenase